MLPAWDLYVGGGDMAAWSPAAVSLGLSNSNNLNLYSCMLAWYEGGGGLYWNSGYIMAEWQMKKKKHTHTELLHMQFNKFSKII